MLSVTELPGINGWELCHKPVSPPLSESGVSVYLLLPEKLPVRAMIIFMGKVVGK